jgi:hypothetical protein
MALLTRDDVQTASHAITREGIRDLLSLPASRPCVSIYMPTYRSGSETQQNPIRFKNLLRSVQERLIETGMKDTDAAELMAPVRELVDDQTFWQLQSEGLALFRSPEVLRTYRLPTSLDEHAVVENRFHLKPLFSLLSGDGQFYIVTLSLKSIRLIVASRHSAREIEMPDVPKSFEEAMGPLTRQQSAFQPVGGRGVSRSPVSGGHGRAEDDIKAEILDFFNRADKAMMKYMDRSCPVVLAGVEYLLPRYKETTEHPKVQEEGLTGNAEGLSAEELRDAAWEIVEPLFLEDRKKAAERYGDNLGTGRSSNSHQDILPAAHEGRIDTLFVARGVRLWGTYDGQARKARLEEDQTRQTNSSEDLLDLAAVQTFLNGGTVYAVPQQEVPDGHAMAALFRS